MVVWLLCWQLEPAMSLPGHDGWAVLRCVAPRVSAASENILKVVLECSEKCALFVTLCGC